MRVLFAPEVEDDLFDLVKILVQKGYLGTYEFAISYVEELVNYIQSNLHIALKKKAPVYFNQYGCDLWYISYRRNTSTTWYIFFSKTEDTYFVKLITNNHVIAQHL